MIRRSWALKCGAVLACAFGAGFLPAPASAAPSDKVRLSGLADVAFGTIVSGFTSAASQQTCNSGPAASATLTVIVRATSLGSVQAGSYAGTLQITIAPE
jgi:hypothetical protein